MMEGWNIEILGWSKGFLIFGFDFERRASGIKAGVESVLAD